LSAAVYRIENFTIELEDNSGWGHPLIVTIMPISPASEFGKNMGAPLNIGPVPIWQSEIKYDNTINCPPF
jgi:hypothetical protein